MNGHADDADARVAAIRHADAAMLALSRDMRVAATLMLAADATVCH